MGATLRRTGAGPRRLVLAAVAAAVLTLLLAAAHWHSVGSQAALRDVAFGLPFHWVEQDLSARTPPSFPATVRAGSPWEHPTDLRLVPAAANLLTLFLALTVAQWWGRRLRERGRSGSR